MNKPAKADENELAKANPNMTPNDLLEKAVSGNADVEVMERLMSLQERYEEKQAKKAFDQAMADLRSDLPKIVKNQEVDHKGAKYKYERLSDVTEELAPVMADHGLSFRWKTDTEGKKVTVECIISHEMGHMEKTRLSAPLDSSGSKNTIQGIGSALTYLQRYTLKAAVGVAAATDDDAQSYGSSSSSQKNQEDDREKAPCPVHDGEQLIKRENDKNGEWWSHKHEGEWCNANPRKRVLRKAREALEASEITEEEMFSYLDETTEHDIEEWDSVPYELLKAIRQRMASLEEKIQARQSEERQSDEGDEKSGGEHELDEGQQRWIDKTVSEIKDLYQQGTLSITQIIDKENELPADKQRSTLLDWASAQMDKEAADI